MKYLITGGCGFIGSNLAAEVLKQNEELFVFDNLYRYGSADNLNWLEQQGKFKFIHKDIRNINDVENTIKEIKPDIIFHLAGQVAMTTSLMDPRMDFEVNVLGTHNVLESIRKYSPDTSIFYSSSNKVYGDLNYLQYEEQALRYNCKDYPEGFDENIKLDFQSPYGCSKGSADQYLLDYNRMFGIKTVVFRHSTMYGGNQHATFDQGWIGWFIQKALDIKFKNVKEPFTISGNGKQVRDILHSGDVVNLYFNAVKYIEKIQGNAFNIGGGVENSLSLLELFNLLEKYYDIKMNYRQMDWRQNDQLVFIANNKKIKSMTNWIVETSKYERLVEFIKWLEVSYR